VRQDLQEALASGDLSQEQIDEAMLAMYIAEGSDWFWWYGADQNSGNDDAFDRQFRAYLARVYEIIDQEPPAFVSVPIIPQAALEPTQPDAGLVEGIHAEGVLEEGEWDSAGYYDLDDPRLSRLYYAFDEETLYLRLDTLRQFQEWSEAGGKLGIYFIRGRRSECVRAR
jgi:alpha-amylase/alpha-mannosidase (GH57 family)